MCDFGEGSIDMIGQVCDTRFEIPEKFRSKFQFRAIFRIFGPKVAGIIILGFDFSGLFN
jgi:hypothetical protein